MKGRKEFTKGSLLL